MDPPRWRCSCLQPAIHRGATRVRCGVGNSCVAPPGRANRFRAGDARSHDTRRGRHGIAAAKTLLASPTSTTEDIMANISVRKENGGQPLTRAQTWDPVAWARDLLRWDPFREMMPTPPFPAEMTFAPAFEVKETKDGYTFKADVPGVADKDIEITRTGNRLTIGGKRESEKEDKGETFYTMERSYGSFTRVFTLPDGVDGDHIQADLKDGVLTIVAPKLPESQAKKIAVKTSEKKS
jgi:HSP20 family protein